MTPTHRKAMELALARLQSRTDTADLDAIAALNEALAEQQEEPVAWAKDTGKKLRITHMPMSGDEGWRPLGYIDTSPQPAKREPLTDEEIGLIADAIPVDEISDPDTWHIRLARAIERAHGITGETK